MLRGKYKRILRKSVIGLDEIYALSNKNSMRRRFLKLLPKRNYKEDFDRCLYRKCPAW